MERPNDFDPREPIALRQRGRHALEALVYWTGLGFTWLKTTAPSGAVILTYHSVAPPEWTQWIDPRNRIEPERFAQQMEFLARHRRVIALDELVAAIEAGEPQPAGSVVVTFDDGYRDTLEVAAPILARHGLPATVYIPTAIVSRGEPLWSDRVYTWFRTRRGRQLRIPGAPAGGWDLTTRHGARAAFAAVSERLLRSWPSERNALLAHLEDQLDPECGDMPRLTLDWNELRELRRRHPRLEIGLHTAEHVDLTAEADDSVRDELKRCIADAERELGTGPRHFAYPYDRASDATRGLVEEQGLRTAVCSGRRRCRVSASADRLALPRLNAPRSMTSLRFWTSGAYPTLSPAMGRA
jgi:peptidoglycan/xylan/chitin deacetylase (PgdA/CDA1 family)